jgi:hypothetical protein
MKEEPIGQRHSVTAEKKLFKGMIMSHYMSRDSGRNWREGGTSAMIDGLQNAVGVGRIDMKILRKCRARLQHEEAQRLCWLQARRSTVP